ncbi:MAG: 23S rRNA (guanosine(2251)-2'-O)-methyltransferase RlmB [Candidatus Abyssobacteria bacterium SURF_5]|uniref:23S rRNA (Guanosine(2251)-2'-O)-methyltransferase RlmB n=1 Tax=Abyssobacteria bacterium (strain SURF_5) TaxID=2093360 RepID=A0A3A4NW81_ABYX5|nr:MAG: 23S rRNA (guanosine(2251)-2'-O)-methyltransferase RlmB [Candidatus Abyssubacteria bacterium SURF_5]
MEETGYVYGRRAVMEVLTSSPERINKIFLAEGDHGRIISEIRELAKQHHIVLKFVPRRALEKYVPHGSAHQGIVASVAPVEYADPEGIMQPFKGTTPALIVVLDEISDPQNLGAILRTAEAVGVSGVLIPRHRSAGLTPVVAKHSAGASQYVPVARVTNLAQTIDALNESEVSTVGAAGDAEKTLYEMDFAVPTAIVIGSEGAGLRPLVRRQCSELARIPMVGKIESLNASVAAAVFLYEAFRQRRFTSSSRSSTSNPP